MKANIKIQDTFTISEGVAIVLSKSVEVDQQQIADALRQMVDRECPTDDAGLDWFYDEESSLVFIGGDREWIASTNPKHVQLLKTADMLDGSDYSAATHGFWPADSKEGKG